MSAGRTARLRILIAAVLFSTAGAGIKLAAFGPWQVVVLRSAIAAATILAVLPASRRRWNARVVLVGAACAALIVLFVWANKLTTAANTIYLQAAGPAYVLLLGPWLLREPIRRKDLILMAAVGLGFSLFFVGNETPAATAPDPLTGNALAALGGLFWALTIIGLRWASTGRDGGTGTAAAVLVAGNVIAAAACLPLALPLPQAAPIDWLTVAFLGVFQLGLAYACLAPAVPHVPAFEFSLLTLLEPALNPIWAWIVHGEKPGAWSLAGGAIIIASTTLKTWIDSRRA